MIFAVSSSFGGAGSVTIDFPQKKVHVLLPDVEISDVFLEWLKTADTMYANEYPVRISAKIDEINHEMQKQARLVVEHAKYFLGLDQIADDVVTGMHGLAWSQDAGVFHPFPGLLSGSFGFKYSIPLNEQTRRGLQEGLDKGYKPFLAMRHLYRAMQESTPRFKWIDATIAAELAIKEFLARAHPELEVLLVHLPSPPLQKLYREVLEKCTGVRSPYWKELDQGSQKRNKLVHQPEAIAVTESEAFEYVNTVMKAIHHLYTLLYPDWTITNNLSAFERGGL